MHKTQSVPTPARNILIISATSLEIKPLLSELGIGKIVHPYLTRYSYNNFGVDVLVSGVGMVPTAAFTGMVLCENKYEAVINAGICGSFNRRIPIGEVLNVNIDCLPETGAEDGEYFLSLIDLNLIDKDEFPYSGGNLVNDSVFDSSLIKGLPLSKGVTVNTVHGNSRNIKAFLKRNNADIESMEGAAFMFACKVHKIRHLQIRCVSNYIEDRDVTKWDIPLAVENLNRFLLDLLNE
jgi:futalosine hydrolase